MQSRKYRYSRARPFRKPVVCTEDGTCGIHIGAYPALSRRMKNIIHTGAETHIGLLLEEAWTIPAVTVVGSIDIYSEKRLVYTMRLRNYTAAENTAGGENKGIGLEGIAAKTGRFYRLQGTVGPERSCHGIVTKQIRAAETLEMAPQEKLRTEAAHRHWRDGHTVKRHRDHTPQGGKLLLAVKTDYGRNKHSIGMAAHAVYLHGKLLQRVAAQLACNRGSAHITRTVAQTFYRIYLYLSYRTAYAQALQPFGKIVRIEIEISLEIHYHTALERRACGSTAHKIAHRKPRRLKYTQWGELVMVLSARAFECDTGFGEKRRHRVGQSLGSLQTDKAVRVRDIECAHGIERMLYSLTVGIAEQTERAGTEVQGTLAV